MKETIIFICKEKGKKSKNEVDRELFKNLMEAVKLALIGIMKFLQKY